MMSDVGSSIEVLLIVEADIATTQLTEQLLSECSCLGIRYKKVYLTELDQHVFSESALPLFVRTADPVAISWMQSLKRSNIPYFYYIDDNFWLIDGDTALAKYYQHPIIRRSLKFAVEKANVVITNSVALREFILPKNRNTVLLPAFFDFSLLPTGDVKTVSEYRIGFAGSASREADLEVLKDVIPYFLAQRDDVVFEFVGCLPKWLEQGPRVRFFGHMNSYADYIAFQVQRGWKIGLAPLDNKTSNRYKTNNKYREYSAFRCAGIYTDSESYVDSVVDGKTGLLIKNNTAACWIAAIERYLDDEKFRTSIAERAYSDVYQKFDIVAVAAQWAELFQQGARELSNSKTLPVRSSFWGGISRKLTHYWLLVEISMYEGGWRLTFSRAFRKLLRHFSQREKR
ncbi:glycosyltransferase [Pseudomonas sp. TH49]|uniref:glycosyltransferase n=1 Tax=Pseudomonas sp. TH49 TaxID=2796413 RepID=UPI001912DAB2|nr:glycosyltransferase [Pseudomonas sp. TH49]MBK5342867.1 glycosyltransferase [Pseudomonas sp. TH49]